MSGVYGPADEGESIATIQAAVDAGVNLLDTGDFYGMGHNEMLLKERSISLLRSPSLVGKVVIIAPLTEKPHRHIHDMSVSNPVGLPLTEVFISFSLVLDLEFLNPMLAAPHLQLWNDHSRMRSPGKAAITKGENYGCT
jgi:hypothetical protein